MDMKHELSDYAMGMFRILVGLYTSCVLAFRFMPAVDVFFSPRSGILGRCYSEQWLDVYGHPFNPLLYAQTDWAIQWYLGLCLLLSVMLLVGIWSRFSAFGLLVLFAFWFHRFPLVFFGFDAYMQAMLGLVVLLPTDRRFSLMGPERTKPASSSFGGPWASLALVQVAVIYGFNGLFKYGEKWLNGSAVAFAASDPDRAGPLADWLLANPLLCTMLTYATLLGELALPFLLLLPMKSKRLRLAASVFILALHWSIALAVDVGLFKWIAGSAAVLVLPHSWWMESRPGRFLRSLDRPAFRMRARWSSPKPMAQGFLALGVALMLLSNIQQWLGSKSEDPVRSSLASTALGSGLAGMPLPKVHHTPLYQYWHLFAPNPPKERGYAEMELVHGSGSRQARFNGSQRLPGTYTSSLEQQFINRLMVRRGRNAYEAIAQSCMLQRELHAFPPSGFVAVEFVVYSNRPETLEELQGGFSYERIVLERYGQNPQSPSSKP